MFQTAPGVSIPFPEKIPEQFQVYENQCIQANISYEKLRPLITEIYQSFPEPLFFVLQVPLTLPEEQRLGQGNKLHQAVYYLDGQTRGRIESVLNDYGAIILADGISQFAIASHANHEEVFVQKYKVTDLYSPLARRFIPVLQKYGLTETEHLFTAWDTFSQETPGRCRRVSVNGKDIFTVVRQLEKLGMYRAKTIEDP